eukprot:TRINITY_DN886_c0_g5_i2.p1 TRINITY_DN886_c0_g5~~TRINITY_DN886_c0_g5_i2.p1  ORF type:complete len:379 (-),score=54.54 TRINITY_DN886_c0_g5_i2:1036-2073(-)
MDPSTEQLLRNFPEYYNPNAEPQSSIDSQRDEVMWYWMAQEGRFVREGEGLAPASYYVERLVEEESLLDEVAYKKSLLQEVYEYVFGGDNEFVRLFSSKFPDLPIPNFSRKSIRAAIQESLLKEMPLLLFMHNSKESDLIKYHLQSTVCNPEAIPFLNLNFVVFGADAATPQGQRIMRILQITKLPCISVRASFKSDISNILYQTDTLTTEKAQFLTCLEDIVCNYHEVLLRLRAGQPFAGMEFRQVRAAAGQELSGQREDAKCEIGVDVCEMAFRFASGKCVVRRFKKSDTVGVVYSFVRNDPELEGKDFFITQPHTKKVYGDMEATLEEEGLFPKAAVHVKVV